ncbi:hypothetical protein ES708_02165 [subsurface metagenome]
MRKGLILGGLVGLSFVLTLSFLPGYAATFPYQKKTVEIEPERAQVATFQRAGMWDSASSYLGGLKESLAKYIPVGRNILRSLRELGLGLLEKLRRMGGKVVGVFKSVWEEGEEQGRFPRHRNPLEIREESFLPAALIALYARVVKLQTSGEWDLASSQLRRTLLSYIPEPLRYIFTRLNELIQTVGDKLKKVKEDIDACEALLKQGEIDEAGEVLEGAWETLLETERILDDLDSAVDELRGKLGASAAEKLREEIAPLAELAEEYKRKIQDLYREVKEGKRREATFLEISVAERKVVVGDSFEISGSLEREKGKPLAEKKVDILLEEEKVLEVATGEDGKFKGRIDFPFLYKKDVQVLVFFIPQGEDEEKYYGDTSNEVLIEPIFYTPIIKATYQEPVYPVLPFKVQGELMLEGEPLRDYPVKIKVEEKIIEVSSDEAGKFEAEVSLPSGVGKTFPLRIFTPSREIIGPASLIINLPISYKVPSMMVELPSVAVPFSPLEVKGEVDLEGGLMERPAVRVITGGENITTVVEGKSFQVKISIPLASFSGWKEINLFLYPQEAWISSLNRRERVLLVNPLTLFPFFALLALFIGVSRRRKKETEEVEGVLEKRKEGLPEEEEAPEEKEITKLRGTYTPIRIYAEAVDWVSRCTGIGQAPGHTIKEYLELVKEPLGQRYADFDFISLVTERFLYRLRRVSEEELAEARKRLSRLKRGR